jgi:hypothetical protein
MSLCPDVDLRAEHAGLGGSHEHRLGQLPG